MKKILLLLAFLLTFTLSSCNINKLDYHDFSDHSLPSYAATEYASHNRHILYYYDSNDESSNDIKDEILSFFDEFELLEFYFLDTNKITTETSLFGAYDSEPVIFVISSNEVYKEYRGLTQIREFIVEYSNIEFDYDLFEDQHLTTYEEVLNIESDSYILYYYLNNCPYCIQTKPYFLPWAFTKNVEDIYFMEGSSVQNADVLPTELIVLNSGTPILVLMSNGEFTNEFYSGTDSVLGYINEVGTDKIIPDIMNLEYTDFLYNHIDYTETLTITDELHFEYYYSPFCAHCNYIKTDILYFLNRYSDIEYYLIDTSSANGTVKIDSFIGTPSLYVVYNGEVIDEYIGSQAIPQFIIGYKNGSIDYSEYK